MGGGGGSTWQWLGRAPVGERGRREAGTDPRAVSTSRRAAQATLLLKTGEGRATDR
jgi:hypothetical protein